MVTLASAILTSSRYILRENLFSFNVAKADDRNTSLRFYIADPKV